MAAWQQREYQRPAATVLPERNRSLVLNSPVKPGHCGDVCYTTALPPEADVRPRSCYVAEVPQAVMPPFVRWRRRCNLTFEPPQRDVPKSLFGGRLMPSAG